MNLDFDFSVVSRFLRGVWDELRQRHLWPVALLLVAAAVAVPVLLSKSSSPTTVAQAPLPPSSPALGKAIPALNVQTKVGTSKLTGAGRDPFAGTGSSSPSGSTTPASGAGSAASAAGSAASSAGSSVTSALTGGGSSAGNSTTSASGSGSSTGAGSSNLPVASGGNPPSIIPSSHPKPAPTGLTATQSYEVSLAITTSSGGLNTLDPLARLTVLPSSQQPLLVELGVLHGGKRVLFALQPGTVVRGPGTCTPGPIDCEILSLAPDQTEAVGTQVGSIVSAPVALFAVVGVTAKSYSSAASAAKARRVVSAAGRALLDASPHPALSLFPYEPSLGSIVDIRDLTVSH